MADGTLSTSSSARTSDAREALPVFALTMLCLGVAVPVPAALLASMLAGALHEQGGRELAEAIAGRVLRLLYPGAMTAPAPLDVLRLLGVVTHSYTNDDFDEVFSVEAGRDWAWMPTTGDCLRLVVDARKFPRIPQALPSAIGFAVLHRLGLNVREDADGMDAVATEIGRGILIPRELVEQVVSDFGESVSAEQFEQAHRDVVRRTHADTDDCLDAVCRTLEKRNGHMYVGCPVLETIDFVRPM